MPTLFQILKNHKWAVLFAFLTAVIVAFPQIYFPYHHSQEYQGIYITCTDNEIFYLHRVREVQDGHPSLGSAVFKEGKDDPYTQPPLGEILIAYLGKIFFLDINNTLLLARFILPFLIFLAVYGFVFSLSKDKLAALSGSSAFSLAMPLFARQALFILSRGEALETTFLSLFRPVQPQIHFLFFFGFLFFFWLFFERRRWLWGILSALILGLSFYVYLYTWTFLYVFVAVLTLILLWQKRWQEAKRVILVSLGGVILAIPYFLNFYEALLYPSFKDISLRYALLNSHQPILGFLVPTLFFIFLLFFPRKYRDRYLFSLALIITPFIVLNQQLITGKILQHGHYHWHTIRPLAIIFLIIILFYLAKLCQEKWRFFRNKNILKALAVLIMGVSIYVGISVQTSSYKACEADILKNQRYAPIIQWLNANTQKEETVLADWGLAAPISVYTSLNLFDAFSARLYLSATKERMLDLVFLSFRLDGVGPQEAKNIFLQEEERRKISKYLYDEYYRDKPGGYAAIPDEELYFFAEKYEDFLLIPLAKLFKIYNVKYALWDKENYPRWELSQYPSLKEVYEENGVKIYQII